MKLSEEQLKVVLDKVAKNLSINQWSYNRSRIDDAIENYFGILVPVTLVIDTGSKEDKNEIFIKFAPIDVIDQLKSTVKLFYKVEEYTYCHLIPIYKRLCNVNIDLFIPECLYANSEANNEVIVMKDMRSEGFKRYDKDEFFDKDHIRLSLEALAKFHALSAILKKKDGDFNNDLMKPYTDKHHEAYYHQIKKTLQTQTGLFNGTLFEVYLKNLLSNLSTFVISSTTEANYLVYGHGDFWKDNILFKYKNSKPIQACLVDFQMSRKMSPAHDILHLLLTSVGTIDISQHHEYLNIYLDTFHRILNENGLDSTYSADELNHDFKIVAPYCIAIAIMSFSLWLGFEPDNFVKSKNISKNIENSIILKNTVKNILEQLNIFGYIQL